MLAEFIEVYWALGWHNVWMLTFGGEGHKSKFQKKHSKQVWILSTLTSISDSVFRWPSFLAGGWWCSKMDRFNLKMIKDTLGVEIESNCNCSYCYSLVLISISSPYCLGLWCYLMIWIIDLELQGSWLQPKTLVFYLYALWSIISKLVQWNTTPVILI